MTTESDLSGVDLACQALLAARVQAVGLDADSGRLGVVPNAPACGTKRAAADCGGQRDGAGRERPRT
ncbi:hypothetical protein [Streptomyces sp. NPDC002403]